VAVEHKSLRNPDLNDVEFLKSKVFTVSRCFIGSHWNFDADEKSGFQSVQHIII